MPKSSLLKNSSGNIQTTTEEIKEVSIFPKKVNAIARLEIELTYNDVAVQHVSHSATRTSPNPVETV